MKNKMVMLLLSGVLLVSLSACNDGSSAYVSGVTEKEAKNDDTAKAKETKETKEETVKLYFYDSQAENLIEVSQNITLAEDESIEEKILESLQEKSENKELSNVIGKCITINSVEVEEKIATVDVSSENLSGSSTEEMFFIEGIVKALTQLETIEGVKFTVDGAEAETLMGHMEATLTYTEEDVLSPIVPSEEEK